MSRLLRVAAVAVMTTALSVGCGTTGGDAGTWDLADRDAIAATSVSFTIGVSRLGCAGGRTGRPLEPRITYESNRVLILAEVKSNGPGAATCPSNDVVPVVVELREPLGQRDLVDEACVGKGPAVDTSFCVDPTRWSGR